MCNQEIAELCTHLIDRLVKCIAELENLQSRQQRYCVNGPVEAATKIQPCQRHREGSQMNGMIELFTE